MSSTTSTVAPSVGSGRLAARSRGSWEAWCRQGTRGRSWRPPGGRCAFVVVQPVERAVEVEAGRGVRAARRSRRARAVGSGKRSSVAGQFLRRVGGRGVACPAAARSAAPAARPGARARRRPAPARRRRRAKWPLGRAERAGAATPASPASSLAPSPAPFPVSSPRARGAGPATPSRSPAATARGSAAGRARRRVRCAQACSSVPAAAASGRAPSVLAAPRSEVREPRHRDRVARRGGFGEVGGEAGLRVVEGAQQLARRAAGDRRPSPARPAHPARRSAAGRPACRRRPGASRSDRRSALLGPVEAVPPPRASRASRASRMPGPAPRCALLRVHATPRAGARVHRHVRRRHRRVHPAREDLEQMVDVEGAWRGGRLCRPRGRARGRRSSRWRSSR